MPADPSAFPTTADHGTLVLSLVLLIGVGVVLLVWGLARRAADHRLRATTAARVVAAERRGPAGRVGRPVVYRFATDDGSTVELPTVGLHLHPHHGGASVPVRYDPDDPTHAHADEPIGLALPWAAAVGVGLALIAIALGAVLPHL